MRRDIVVALLTVCLAAVGVQAFDDVAATDSFPSNSPQDSPYAADPVDVVVSQSRRPATTRVPASRRVESATDARLQRIEEAINRLESQVEALQRSIPTPHALLVPTRRHEPGFRGLYMMNRDGTNPQFLVSAPGMIATSDAAWSNSGRFLAMNGLPKIDAFSDSKMFIYTLEGPDAGAIRDLGYGNTPAWSPDDRQIAFMLNPGNPGGHEGGLWLMQADGSNRHRIAQAWWPRWSPDGNVLCCHGWRSDGQGSLMLVDPVTGSVRTLFEGSPWSLVDYAGNWSPDGDRIAFVGERDGIRHLATISSNGSLDSIRTIYTNENPQLDMFGPPSWSRDGRQMIFSMQQSGPGPRRWWKSKLYSMAPDVPCAPVALDGGSVGNINRMPSWSPDSSQIIFSSER